MLPPGTKIIYERVYNHSQKNDRRQVIYGEVLEAIKGRYHLLLYGKNGPVKKYYAPADQVVAFSDSSASVSSSYD